ncbi:MAG TPA: MFS transporter [Roseateles sp.]
MQVSLSTSPTADGLAPTAGGMLVAMVSGSVALLMLGLQPIVLGEMLGAGRVSLEGVGLVAMAEIVTLGLGVLMGDWLGWLTRPRSLSALACACIIALDLLTPWAGGDGQMALVRAAAGLAEGLLLWVTTAAIVRSGNPARSAGVFFVAQTAAQALLGLVLARWVIAAHGWQAAFWVLAAAGAVPLLLLAGLPARLAPLVEAEQGRLRWSLPAVQALAVAFLLMAALGAFWAYAEPLGLRAGLEAQAAQTVIAAALAAQIAGGTVGTAMVGRLGAVRVLALAALALGAVGAVVHVVAGLGAWFFPLCMAFAFVWLFMIPFHTALAFAADRSGRVASLMPAAQLLGSAAGPLVASLVVVGEDPSRAALVSAACATVALAVLILRRAP